MPVKGAVAKPDVLRQPLLLLILIFLLHIRNRLIPKADVSCGKVASKSNQRCGNGLMFSTGTKSADLLPGLSTRRRRPLLLPLTLLQTKKIGNTLTRISGISKNGVEGAISDLAHLVRELKSLNQRKISLHNSHYFSLP